MHVKKVMKLLAFTFEQPSYIIMKTKNIFKTLHYARQCDRRACSNCDLRAINFMRAANVLASLYISLIFCLSLRHSTKISCAGSNAIHASSGDNGESAHMLNVISTEISKMAISVPFLLGPKITGSKICASSEGSGDSAHLHRLA